jgi:hypothetical protein
MDQCHVPPSEAGWRWSLLPWALDVAKAMVATVLLKLPPLSGSPGIPPCENPAPIGRATIF